MSSLIANRRTLLASALAGAGFLILRPLPAEAASDDQSLIDSARITVDNFAHDGQMSDLRRKLAQAKGVFVVPQLLKASFIIGGEGGSGVLLAKTGTGWSEPAIYTMGAGSIGLQIGGEASQVMLVLMNDNAVNAILRNEFKLGADATVAAGPVGMGVEAATTSNLGADIFSYAKTKGLAAGISVEGAVISARHSRNTAYYGKEAHPRNILYDNVVSNPGTQALRQALTAAEMP
ncbi:MAG: lipid-binding SYLF domain-containing protein [Ferrovibrio sp.]|uniref:lipid-binding SYLF domain-containing protein n=1 Tax=Ferrovibrio sp. TaxID=1917215 RepID=UPI002616907B|nr:lipid-binding SYLF domain-containing protein [Ferrovibrio sp.]MCW0235849.1 lipid-binding SYLF domain-containing protein [Ferrovibrio sp.]